MANTVTLQNIRDITYSIIKQPESAKAYSLTLMDSFINKAQRDICYGSCINLATREELEKQSLSFLNKTQFINTVQYTTTNGNASIWATTLILSSTTNMPTSWLIWIEWDCIRYTWISWSTLTWISAPWNESIKYGWVSWCRVFIMYDLPTDYWQMTSASYDTWPQWMQFRMIWIDYRDIREPWSNSQLYRVFRDDTSQFYNEYYYTLINDKYFLPFISASNMAIRFEYNIAPTTMVSSTDLATIPDQFSLNTIPYLAVSEMMMNRWEADEWIKLNNFWYKEVKKLYKTYQTKTKELIYWQRIRTASDWFINI